jgi:mono/diheme cytochrome c family protein
MRKFIWGVIFTVFIFIVGGLGVAMSGFINTDADQPPGGLEKWLAHKIVKASIRKRAPQVNNPLPITDANLAAGMKTYLMACAECHGGADKKPSVFGVALHPPAPQLIVRPMHDPEWQIFYVTKHGFRNTGMPAWQGLMSDNDIWQMTAFLSRIDTLPPAVQEEWNKAAH